MKANEAPEKLYYAPHGDMRENHPITDNDIEYIRKDAFIEKAVSYLEGTLFNEVCYGEIRPDIVQAYINDFKKAMEQ